MMGDGRRCETQYENDCERRDETLFVGHPLVLRLLPPLLELRFPILGPRTAEVIDVALVHRRHLRRPAIRSIDDRALHAAFDIREALLGIVEGARLLPRGDHMERTRKRLGIVERRLDRDRLAVARWTEHLDRFHLV